MAPPDVSLPAYARQTELQKKDQSAWSVQSLSDSGIKEVPKEYVQPIREEFTFPVCDEEGIDIPVINYTELQAGSVEEEEKFLDACEKWGFFQLANHGISEDLVVKTQHVAKEFFYLPPEDKKKYIASNPDSVAVGYGRINFLTDDCPPDWADSLVIDADSNTDISTWPSKPEDYRKTMLQYSKETTALGFKLLSIITRSLGLPEDYVDTNFGEVGMQLSANFYPRCPQPELVFGLSPHSDPQFITLLLQDMEGLHVLRDERWILVKQRHNHFVVNLGDQTEILSNGKYKSTLHRAVVNNKRDRLSLSAFLRPPLDSYVGPAAQIIDDDHPPKYQTVKYGDFLGYSSAYGSLGKRNLDSRKL
nr:Fe(II)/2-oxoglutarate-dependent dioxygenase 5 [Phlegmariurus tetrastichus]